MDRWNEALSKLHAAEKKARKDQKVGRARENYKRALLQLRAAKVSAEKAYGVPPLLAQCRRLGRLADRAREIAWQKQRQRDLEEARERIRLRGPPIDYKSFFITEQLAGTPACLVPQRYKDAIQAHTDGIAALRKPEESTDA